MAPTTHAVGGEPVTPARIVPATPEEIRIDGAKPIPRTIHYDARGFLLETLRRDDDSVNGSKFAMSYTSATVSHAFRDRDRWHAHRIQSDRFLVVLGEMTLALYDARPTSPTHGVLDVVQMVGAPYEGREWKARADVPSSLVPIPPGVLHCIGNLSNRPFVLTNFPTELYDPGDEGRVPFREVTVETLGGPFDWEIVWVPR